MAFKQMDPGLTKLIERMNFIGEAKKGYKPCFNAPRPRYIQDSIFSLAPFKRSFKQESRDLMCERIKEILNDCEDALTAHSGGRYFVDLFRALHYMKRGIENLKATYSEDTDITIQLDQNINQIRHWIDEGKRFVPKEKIEEIEAEISNKPKFLKPEPEVASSSPPSPIPAVNFTASLPSVVATTSTVETVVTQVNSQQKKNKN